MDSAIENQTEKLLIGNKQIARYCDVCVTTIWSWRKQHGFPAAQLPSGRVATTKRLIDEWLMSRMHVQTMIGAAPGRPRKSGEDSPKNSPQAVDNNVDNLSHEPSD